MADGMGSLDPLSPGSYTGLDTPTTGEHWLGLISSLVGPQWGGQGLGMLLDELQRRRVERGKALIGQGLVAGYQSGLGGLADAFTGAGTAAAASGTEAAPTPAEPPVGTGTVLAPGVSRETSVAAPTAPTGGTPAANPQAALLRALLAPPNLTPPEGLSPADQRAWQYGTILGRHQRVQELTQTSELLRAMNVGQLTPYQLLTYMQRGELARERDVAAQRRSDESFKRLELSLGAAQKRTEEEIKASETRTEESLKAAQERQTKALQESQRRQDEALVAQQKLEATREDARDIKDKQDRIGRAVTKAVDDARKTNAPGYIFGSPAKQRQAEDQAAADAEFRQRIIEGVHPDGSPVTVLNPFVNPFTRDVGAPSNTPGRPHRGTLQPDGTVDWKHLPDGTPTGE